MEGILEGGSHGVTRLDPDEAIRRTLRAGAAAGAPTPSCLDDDTVAALVEGTLDPATREVVIPHVATCAWCRDAVASVTRALADDRVAREVTALEGRGRGRLLRILLPLAAAAGLLLVLVWPRPMEDGGHRGPPPVASAPVPIAPVGVVASASPLLWTAVVGADRYRVTLAEASGHVLYETQVADTVLALPDSIVLVPGRSYVWLVEARTGFDRWQTSQLVEFSTTGATPP